MSLTIKLSHAARIALEEEAAARNQSSEQTASELIDAFFDLHGVREDSYEEWFRAKVKEGLRAARAGEFASPEEAEQRAMARRQRLLMLQRNYDESDLAEFGPK